MKISMRTFQRVPNVVGETQTGEPIVEMGDVRLVLLLQRVPEHGLEDGEGRLLCRNPLIEPFRKTSPDLVEAAGDSPIELLLVPREGVLHGGRVLSKGGARRAASVPSDWVDLNPLEGFQPGRQVLCFGVLPCGWPFLLVLGRTQQVEVDRSARALIAEDEPRGT